MQNFYMPTKKRRVGFIPRSEVLNLLNKLSFENNLSISKIINNLVEEALYKRGMFNIKTGKSLNKTDLINLSIENNEKTKIINKNFSSEFTNAKNQNIN